MGNNKKTSILALSISEILNGLPDFVCVTSLRNQVIFINSALEQRCGCSDEQAHGQTGFWKFNRENQKKTSDGSPESIIYSKKLDGWFAVKRNKFSMNDGSQDGYIWTAREVISPEPNLNKTIPQKSSGHVSELYHTLFETSPSGILVLDKNGIILDVNHALCNSTNYQREELVNQYIGILALPQNHHLIKKHIDIILGGRKLEHEVTSRRKDGSFFYSLLIESAIQLPDGQKGVLSVSNDITRRKLMELALIESEQKFRTIANHTANWEIWFNNRGEILWTNPAVFEFTGYTPDEIIKMPDFLDVLLEQSDIQKIRDIFMSTKGTTHRDFIVKCFKKDGTQLWLSTTWTTILNENGETEGVRSSSQDVTSRVEAQNAMQQSDGLNRKLNENAPFGMLFYELNEDDELIFSNANPAADRILGLDCRQFIGKKILEAFPNLRHDVVEYYRQAAKNGTTWIAEQLDYADRKIAGAFEVKAFQTVQGKMVALFSDITKRKQTGQALNESRQLFEALTRMAPVGIFRTNALGETTFVNPEWCALTGFSYQEAIQGKFLEAIHPVDRLDRMKEWNKAVKQQIPVISEYRFVRTDGTIIWVQGQAVPELVDSEVKGFIGTITDITELIEIQHELIRSKEKAEASNRLKTTFMKNISHEIRTPLNGIFGFAQLLSSGDYTEEEKLAFNNFLENSISRLTKTIDNIMDVSMMMSGNMVKNEVIFNLRVFLLEVTMPFIAKAEQKKLTIEINGNIQKTEELVIADKLLLKRILDEIIDNAVKFTDEGIVLIAYTIVDENILIEISDTGNGIDSEYLPMIFEPFMQDNVYSARTDNSTGLGLSIVQGAISLLGGTVDVKSSPGKGSSFQFNIPVKLLRKPKSEPADTPTRANIKEKTNPLILIVEDEEINQLFIKRLLSKYTCRILTASSGIHAVELAGQYHDIDLILMDIKMPGMDGYETVEIIKKMSPNVKVVAVTAYSSAADREACLTAGCVDFIAKPFHSRDLFNMLSKTIHWPFLPQRG